MISRGVEQQILTGKLMPGTMPPTEAELAEQFGINRSTVREAIRQLEQEVLVERRSSKRLQVTCLASMTQLREPRAHCCCCNRTRLPNFDRLLWYLSLYFLTLPLESVSHNRAHELACFG
jgi:DNA-binding transcriptional MocR family regulator